jgi:hypothetical protein
MRSTRRRTHLHLEDVVVEEILQLFVGQIDQQLLEAVKLERLETENIQDTCM